METIDEILQKISDRVKREPEFKARLEETPIEILQEEGFSFSEEDVSLFFAELEDTADQPVCLKQTSVITDTLARVSPKCLGVNGRVSPKCIRRLSKE